MIDFAGLQGLSIPEGVVTEIRDASGRVLWTLPVAGETVVLEVEKITSDTYAGSTTYTGEQFILLDIYPKTNGTVSITYGGLTKTITDTSGAEEPNAQQVFFGTFNGISDEVETPVSGELTIEGDCVAFATPQYNKSKLDASGTAYNGVLSILSTGFVESIPDSAFGGMLRSSCDKMTRAKLGKHIKYIGAQAFYGCTSLKSITIPASVTSIGDWSFSECTSLSSVNIPYGVTHIGDSAFSGCTGLTRATIPESVTHIGMIAFEGCTGLTSVTIPESVTSIEANPFPGCFENNEIAVASGNVAYKIDGNCLIENATSKLIAGYADAVIPLYVTDIGAYAFYICTGLVSITIPASVTSIGGSSFSECTSLSSVNMPYGVTHIGKQAFYGCTSLKSITIPASVTDIGTYAFDDCSNLTSITFENGLGWYFEDTSSITGRTPVNFRDSTANAVILTNSAKACCRTDELFTFTIGSDNEYSCIYGMTWADWIESEYNTIGLEVVDNKIQLLDGRLLYNIDTESAVASTDLLYPAVYVTTGDPITVTIYKSNGTTVWITITAEYGMTWAEWLESEYDTYGLSNYGTFVGNAVSRLQVGSVAVHPAHRISTVNKYTITDPDQ